MARNYKKYADSAYRVATQTQHKDFREAAFADLFDVIPIVGDIANAARIANIKAAQVNTQMRKGVTQVFDFAVGALPIPGVSEALDFLTPTNMLNHLADQLPDPILVARVYAAQAKNQVQGMIQQLPSPNQLIRGMIPKGMRRR